MTLCKSCRLVMRQAAQCARPMSTKASSPSARDMLSKPTWSVRSLLSTTSPDNADPSEIITPKQLHHLLRLSALPLPKTEADQDAMIATLQSQLRFVRAVQRVDAAGVDPLRAIRDETTEGAREATVSLDKLQSLLDAETRVGHYERPRRVRSAGKYESEDWDALATASRRAGRFFVVQSKRSSQEGES